MTKLIGWTAIKDQEPPVGEVLVIFGGVSRPVLVKNLANGCMMYPFTNEDNHGPVTHWRLPEGHKTPLLQRLKDLLDFERFKRSA